MYFKNYLLHHVRVFIYCYYRTVDCRHLLKQVMSSQSTLAQQMKPFHDKSMPSKKTIQTHRTVIMYTHVAWGGIVVKIP